MRVDGISVREDARGAELTATLVWDERSRGRDEIRFLYRNVDAKSVSTPGDALAAVALVPAMAAGEDVFVDAPVSGPILESAPSIARFFSSWIPSWRSSSLGASSIDRTAQTPTQIAAAFSGGVDSYYTLLAPREEPITMVLTTLGLHPQVDRLSDLEPVIAQLSRSARELGRDHVVIESNALAALAKHLRWTPERGFPQWGSLVIAQALALGSVVRRFYVPSSWAFSLVPPWGTHPQLDPLWSTDTLEVVHDELAERSEKVRLIAASGVSLESLYVCFDARPPGNCGHCQKCVGTALMLDNVGALDRAPTLPPPRTNVIRHMTIHPSWHDQYKRLRSETSYRPYRRAITYALWRTAFRSRLRPVARVLRRLSA